jgi:hypothetical protein
MYDPRYRERYNYGPMYAQNGGNSGSSSSNGGSMGSNTSRNYHEGMIPMDYSMYERGGDRYYNDATMRDPREGRSGERRKMYMEGKGTKDKTHQMRELENYMQELSTDLTDMIADASPEEKQMLQ